MVVRAAEGLNSEATFCLLEDREGSIWIGLKGAGLARWLGHCEWTGRTREDGLSGNVVWAIRRDAAGALWVATDLGLNRMTSGASGQTIWRHWAERDGLGGNRVRALAIGPDGAVWAGSYPGGLSRIDPSTGVARRYGAAAGLAEERVPRIVVRF